MAYYSMKYRWQWEINAPSEEVWAHLADSAKLYHTLGITPPQARKEGRKNSQSALLTKLFIPPQQLRFNWVQNRNFEVEIPLYSPVVEKLRLKAFLEPTAGSTTLRLSLEVAPSGVLGQMSVPYLVGVKMAENVQRAIKQIESGTQVEEKSTALSQVTETAEQKLNTQLEELTTRQLREGWVNNLKRLIKYSSQGLLRSVRPHALANQWGIPLRSVLDLLLHSVDVGVMQVRWLLRCPKCMTVRHSKPHLNEIRKQAHCTHCQMDFFNDLSKNVEVAFAPTEEIRPLGGVVQTAADPLGSAHEVTRQIVDEGETRKVQFQIPAGIYRVRSLASSQDSWQQIDLTNQKGATITVEIGEKLPVVRLTPGGTGHTLIIENYSPTEQTVVLEDISWRGEVVVATDMLTHQTYRNLFPHEAIQKAEPLPMGKLAILFADIAGSTAMFLQKGDEASIMLIREFYRFMEEQISLFDGAVIKGIGDTIMAAFPNPVKAVRSLIKLREDLETFNATLPDNEQLSIRLGVHYGPCLATNLNNDFELFGSTINLAASVQGQSTGEDIVLTEGMWEVEEVQELLENSRLTVSPFKAQSKGLGFPIQLYRLM